MFGCESNRFTSTACPKNLSETSPSYRSRESQCCENRLRSGITSSRVVSIVVDCDYDYGNDRV